MKIENTLKQVSHEEMLRHLDNDVLYTLGRKEKYLDGTYAGNVYPEAAKACEDDIAKSQAISAALMRGDELRKAVEKWKGDAERVLDMTNGFGRERSLGLLAEDIRDFEFGGGLDAENPELKGAGK